MFKTANNDSISRPNSRPKLPFPGNGKGKFKMLREGKGNLRLVFPAITGNVNSRSPLNLPKVKCKQRDYIISFTSQMILLTKKQTI